jgi:hypothetical protein
MGRGHLWEAPVSRGAQLVDYLLAREEDGMGASVPLSVGKGVGSRSLREASDG